MLPILHSATGQQLRICDLMPTIAGKTAMVCATFRFDLAGKLLVVEELLWIVLFSLLLAHL